MIRWTVNLAGVDAEADLQRDDRMKAPVNPSSGRRESGKPADAARAGGGTPQSLGTVATLAMSELLELQRARRETSLADSSLGQFWIGPPLSKEEGGHAKGSEIRIFSTFTNAQGRRTVCTVQARQALFRGVDVVNAFLQQTLVPDERLFSRFSTNPRHYKLYIADEFTGEEDLVFQLDSAIQKLTCFAVQPLPTAKLFLFPQRTRLLPTAAEDINLSVEVRPLDSQAKVVKRQVLVPADMLAESLERVIFSRLPGIWLVAGSLRIKYGPVELNINEYYNFGTGCGHMDIPVAERTILSLHRFGVTEVLVQGRVTDGAADVPAPVEDIVINIDAEKAQTLEQFEVIRINKHGARQQRILCVDGERLYMKQPYNAGREASQGCEEKLVRDIEEVRSSPTRPKCLEICYNHASKHEDDHIECTTAYCRALLDEKLRVVQRELRKRDDSERQKVDNVALSRLFGWLKSGFGKYAQHSDGSE
ncbi:uncharacterized protein TEOVI_000014900 [Trypanosoma equiperdum]|uniref:SAPK-interacting protein 1 Pleckstrin-homology domain-containing protein n=2 Tax=Trypanozoon TaxID=39700 RepID=Q580H8_TRYB2|nr:hypothetical protein, conserved [Trypanosoma brucei brucei TREU927]AAX79782.1 hypothetical protein, conserved [Trypanosoma brucei]AAZ12913.1 hypothetical protein, conserved [Trypanosoma brucei brucei TREU927]SCU65208.1 hypothetical protein, conserved [Trypanosoma equiperdum]